MKMSPALKEIAEHLEEIFWDAVGESDSYSQAMEAVDYWVGNNYVPGLQDNQGEINVSVLRGIYGKIPTESEYEKELEEARRELEEEDE